MNFSYSIDRDRHDGTLQATTREGLGIEGHPGYFIELSTHKANRGVSAFCRVYKLDGPFRSTDLFGDWNKVLASNPTGRATEKTIRAVHEQALLQFAQAIDDAQEHTHAKLAREAQQEAESKARAESFSATQAAAAMQDSNYVGHPSHY